MWAASPTWGSPRIVLELNKLGLDVAQSTVERYQPKVPRPTGPGWKAFLKLHAHEMASMDLFVAPTAGLPVPILIAARVSHKMKSMLQISVTAGLIPLAANEATAHHSAALFYDLDGNIEVTGTVTEFHFANPHAIVKLDVIGDDGVAEIPPGEPWG